MRRFLVSHIQRIVWTTLDACGVTLAKITFQCHQSRGSIVIMANWADKLTLATTITFLFINNHGARSSVSANGLDRTAIDADFHHCQQTTGESTYGSQRTT